MEHPNRSTKSVRPLAELTKDRLFRLPREVANEHDPLTRQPCLFVMINGTPYSIPVEIPTPIPYDVFCTLKDSGILAREEGRGF